MKEKKYWIDNSRQWRNTEPGLIFSPYIPGIKGNANLCGEVALIRRSGYQPCYLGNDYFGPNQVCYEWRDIKCY